MVRMQVQLNEEQAAKLRRLAYARGVSISALVREAVDDLDGETQAAARRRRALAAVGKVRSELTDVAERHDEYLQDAWGH
jgi:hypothetical protein